MKSVYLDIETLDFFQDGHIKRLPRHEQVAAIRFGLACTWCEMDGFKTWLQTDVVALQKYLIRPRQQLIGWNIQDFDLPIIHKAAQAKSYQPIVTFDIFDAIRRDTGRWCSLESVAQANLGRGKSANGQQAKEWLTSENSADSAQAIAYCQNDVQLVIDLHAMLLADQRLILPANPKRGHTEILWPRLS